MMAMFSVNFALIRYWKRHKLQAMLCLTGIVVGVAVFTAIRLANEGALTAFSGGMERLTGKATHRVTAMGGGPVSETLIRRLANHPDILAASPILRGRLVLPGAGGLTLTVLGIDPISDPEIRSGEGLVDSAQSGIGQDNALIERFLTLPGAVMVPESLARELKVAAGAEIVTETAQGRSVLRVAGVYRPPRGQERVYSRTVLADISTQQLLFGRQGELDFINLIVAPGKEEAVRKLLPIGVVLERAGARMDRVVRMSEAFRVNVEALGLFALLVGMFLIFNAAAFAVMQRHSMIAVLRCIGASPGRIFSALLLESALLGLAGGVAGVLAGIRLGAVILHNTGATLFEVVLRTESPPMEVAPDGMLWGIGLAVGVGISIAGALQPAIAGARISPLAALRESGRGASGGGSSWRFWIGLALLCWAAAGVALLLPGRSLTAGLVAASLLVFGGAALCPAALAGVSRVGTPLLGRLWGPAGWIAGGNLRQALSSTGPACAALMVALSLSLAITITVRSFKRTFEVWLSQAATADLYLSTDSGNGHGRLPAGFLPALRGLPFVRDVAKLRIVRVVMAGREVILVAVDFPAFAENITLPSRDGTRSEIFARLKSGQVLISEPLAYHLEKERGDKMALPTPKGLRTFVIGAVVQNYIASQGVIYLPLESVEELFGARPPSEAAVWLHPGTDPVAAGDAIAALPGGERVGMIQNAEIRAEALRMFDRTFLITDLLGALAAVVAFIAVISAMTALLENRRRMLGMLRATGFSRGRLGASMSLEAALLALTAGVISWGTGLGMSMVLVFVINRRAFGWTLQFLPGEGPYLWLLAMAVAAALLGSVYPIYRAVRLPVAATIREE